MGVGGVQRVEAAAPRLQALNPRVRVETKTDMTLLRDDDFIKTFDLIVLTDVSASTLVGPSLFLVLSLALAFAWRPPPLADNSPSAPAAARGQHSDPQAGQETDRRILSRTGWLDLCRLALARDNRVRLRAPCVTCHAAPKGSRPPSSAPC